MVVLDDFIYGEPQAAIMGDYVRVTGKKKDDLQDVQNLLKKGELDFDFHFTNYKG